MPIRPWSVVGGKDDEGFHLKTAETFEIQQMMDAANPTPLAKLLNFLQRLEDHKMWYRLEHIRDSVMVLLAIPGERWEVEFFEDGHVEVERFVGGGDIGDEDLLEGLFRSEEGG